MNVKELIDRVKYLRKFGGNVLFVGAKEVAELIIDKLFPNNPAVFIDKVETSEAAKELLLEHLNYDLVFCSPHIEESHSGLDLMDIVNDAHPYAKFILASDCEAYEELDLEPQQLFLNIKTLESLSEEIRDLENL